jgi:uncharacterized protein
VSYSLDVNVLLYASDTSSDRHDAARRFLQSCASRPQVLCLTWPTLMSYLRIATHPRIFAAPLSPREALANVTALLALPHARAVSEMEGFLDAYAQVAGDVAVRGNLVPLPARRPHAVHERPRFSEVRVPRGQRPLFVTDRRGGRRAG